MTKLVALIGWLSAVDGALPRTSETSEIWYAEGQPGTSKSPREISRETGISRSWVQRIAKGDLKLKVYWHQELQLLLPADKEKWLNACKRLKKTTTKRKISRTWFFTGFLMKKSLQLQRRQTLKMIGCTQKWIPNVMCHRLGWSKEGSTSLRALWYL